MSEVKNAVYRYLMEHDEEYRQLKNTLHDDRTLDLEISDNHATVYYRGHGIILMDEKNGRLNIDCADGFRIAALEDAGLLEWINSIPLLKENVNRHKIKNNSLELEFKQVLIRENNCTCVNHIKGCQCVAQNTDYYIADVEYPITNTNEAAKNTDYYIADIECPITNTNKSEKKPPRLDCLAIRRDADKAKRRGPKCKLAIIEMKFGTKSAGSGSADELATISKHIDDLYSYFYANGEELFDERIKEMQESALDSLEIKHEMGLICSDKAFKNLRFDADYEYILVLADYKPVQYKSSLYDEFKSIDTEKLRFLEQKGFSFYIAQSSFMGYGLYSDSMIKWNQWLNDMESRDIEA